jgi:hypothetical protein
MLWYKFTNFRKNKMPVSTGSSWHIVLPEDGTLVLKHDRDVLSVIFVVAPCISIISKFF